MRSPRLELSPRKMEILGLIAEGLTQGEVARTLCLSEETVKWHLKWIRVYGGWKTTAAATAWYGWNSSQTS